MKTLAAYSKTPLGCFMLKHLNGRTLTEIAKNSNGALSVSYLSKFARGLISHPGEKTLTLLERHLGIDRQEFLELAGTKVGVHGNFWLPKQYFSGLGQRIYDQPAIGILHLADSTDYEGINCRYELIRNFPPNFRLYIVLPYVGCPTREAAWTSDILQAQLDRYDCARSYRRKVIRDTDVAPNMVVIVDRLVGSVAAAYGVSEAIVLDGSNPFWLPSFQFPRRHADLYITLPNHSLFSVEDEGLLEEYNALPWLLQSGYEIVQLCRAGKDRRREIYLVESNLGNPGYRYGWAFDEFCTGYINLLKIAWFSVIGGSFPSRKTCHQLGWNIVEPTVC